MVFLYFCYIWRMYFFIQVLGFLLTLFTSVFILTVLIFITFTQPKAHSTICHIQSTSCINYFWPELLFSQFWDLLHPSIMQGPTLTQPTAHLFLVPGSHSNPSCPKQLWSPLGILHWVLTPSQLSPHLNLFLPTPPLAPHMWPVV